MSLAQPVGYAGIRSSSLPAEINVSEDDLMAPDHRSPEAARIARGYAEWTVVSALRSGAPIKSREHVYGVLDQIDFDQLFDHGRGSIEAAEFEAWHSVALQGAIGAARDFDRPMNHGWAAKVVNVYLKTRGYLAGMGRPQLAACLHPPLDAGLWAGLKRRFESDPEMTSVLESAPESISGIQTHAMYLAAIDLCRMAAERLRCHLIEVEQVWLGAAAGQRKPSAHAFVVPPAPRSRVWLWDVELRGEVLGTVLGFDDDHLEVSVPGNTVYLQKSASSHLGRWVLTRTGAGNVELDGAAWHSIET